MFLQVSEVFSGSLARVLSCVCKRVLGKGFLILGFLKRLLGCLFAYRSSGDFFLVLVLIWEFPKLEVPYFGVLIIRILLFRVLY